MRASFAVFAAMVGTALADPADVACPTITKTVLNSACADECAGRNCAFVSTVNVPCGCPNSVPTATLVAPCGGECPYYGCDVNFQTSIETCPLPTTTTTQDNPWWWTRTRTRTWTRTTSTTTPTSTSTTTSWTGVVTSVTTLDIPKTTPCPTITQTTRPAGCDVLQCPVPNCIARETMTIPCGCDAPKTFLFVDGCQTKCPEGCATLTRTSTVTDCPTMGGW